MPRNHYRNISSLEKLRGDRLREQEEDQGYEEAEADYNENNDDALIGSIENPSLTIEKQARGFN